MIVPIPINDNGIPEGNRTVTMQIAPGTGGALAAPTNAVLTIIDTVTSPGQLVFSSPTYTITEGGGVGYTNAYITVLRTSGSAGTVSVTYRTQDGTAQAGLKYLGTNGVLTFGDGETSKTFFVPVINTATAEGPETVLLLLTNATGGATLPPPAQATLTILNTNTGIAFASAANAFTEPSGVVAGTVSLNVVRYNNTNGSVSVNYSTTNGTAVAGVNFVGVTNGILTFNAGESVKPITIATLHDTNVTGDLFFTVGLANPSGSAQLTPPAYTTVTDHDADAGISLIPVACSNPNVEPVSVTYSTGGGTALPGPDYAAASGVLSFTNGALLTYIKILIPPNNQVQSNRTFNVTLSSPTPPGVLWPPALSVQTVTIVGTNTPYGLSFLSPIVINGVWGSTNANNTLGAPEIGDPLIAGFAAQAPVWFQWTAPADGDGEVALDTIGSTSTNGVKADTVMAVFTGTSLANLNQIAANDDLYPLYPTTQANETAQNTFNTNQTVVSFPIITPFGTNYFFFTNPPTFSGSSYGYQQPFYGPSGLRFTAKAGATYYVAVDTKTHSVELGVSFFRRLPLRQRERGADGNCRQQRQSDAAVSMRGDGGFWPYGPAPRHRPNRSGRVQYHPARLLLLRCARLVGDGHPRGRRRGARERGLHDRGWRHQCHCERRRHRRGGNGLLPGERHADL
jgi:Calx-beta domain